MKSHELGWRLPALAVLLYFAQGLPYGLVTELFPIYLRTQGASLATIGLLSTIGLAWTLKLFWAPLVDRTSTYRRWITSSLATMVLTLLSFAFFDLATSPWIWVPLALLALASATQDIAIDAYTISITPRERLGPVNSARVIAYRIALIAAGGGLAAMAGRLGWDGVFIASAVLLGALFVAISLLPEAPREHVAHEGLITGLRRWLARPGSGGVLLVVLFYKFGDAALLPMIKPFWIDRGYSAAETGTVTTTLGISFTIVGVIVGGLFLARYGLFRGLLVLGVLQMASNIGYAVVAATAAGRPAMYTAGAVENFCGGLGTAAFLSFLMAMCDRKHAATEYALLTALFGLTRSLVGSGSGIAAETLGYSGYFWMTVALGIPGLLLVLGVRKVITEYERSAPEPVAA